VASIGKAPPSKKQSLTAKGLFARMISRFSSGFIPYSTCNIADAGSLHFYFLQLSHLYHTFGVTPTPLAIKSKPPSTSGHKRRYSL
jgi:hypothetical protein